MPLYAPDERTYRVNRWLWTTIHYTLSHLHASASLGCAIAALVAAGRGSDHGDFDLPPRTSSPVTTPPLIV